MMALLRDSNRKISANIIDACQRSLNGAATDGDNGQAGKPDSSAPVGKEVSMHMPYSSCSVPFELTPSEIEDEEDAQLEDETDEDLCEED